MKAISPKEISDEECPTCKSLLFKQKFEENQEHFTCSNSSCKWKTWIRNYIVNKKGGRHG